jgi:hypothetical protein
VIQGIRAVHHLAAFADVANKQPGSYCRLKDVLEQVPPTRLVRPLNHGLVILVKSMNLADMMENNVRTDPVKFVVI